MSRREERGDSESGGEGDAVPAGRTIGSGQPCRADACRPPTLPTRIVQSKSDPAYFVTDVGKAGFHVGDIVVFVNRTDYGSILTGKGTVEPELSQ
jgi:hypothetical protein